MLASRLHWRILVATVAVMMAAAFVAPVFVKAPQLRENRALAKPPVLPASLADLPEFRKQADAYIADRFPARAHLIAVLNRLRLFVGVSGSSRVVVGREGWLFFDAGDHMTATRDPLPDAEAAAWLRGLAARTETLKAKGTAYVVLTPPMQEAVYPEFAPGWYALNPDRRAARLARLAQVSQAGEVVYPYAEIMAAKARGTKVYSRHDIHWEGPAAYEGYAALIRRLKAMGEVQEDPRPLSDFVEFRPGYWNKPRTLAQMLGVASFVDIRYLELEDPADETRKRTVWLDGARDWTKPHVVETGQAAKPVLMITMDSFSSALMPFLYRHFSRIVVSHVQDGAWREDLIARFDPDIVVLEVLESGIGHTMRGAPAPSAEAAARIDRAIAAAPLAPRPAAGLPALARTGRSIGAELDRATPARCSMDSASLTGGQLTVAGWISEFADRNTASSGYVRLKGPAGDHVAKIAVDGPRPDVTAVLKGPPATTESGFKAAFDAKVVAPGPYTATVYRRAGGGWIACKGPQALTR